MDPAKKSNLQSPPDRVIPITKNLRERVNIFFGEKVLEREDVGKLFVDRRLDFYETPKLSEREKAKQEKAKKRSKLNASGDGFIGIHYIKGPNKGFEKIINLSTGEISWLDTKTGEINLIMATRAHLSPKKTVLFAKVMFGKQSIPEAIKSFASRLTFNEIREAKLSLLSGKQLKVIKKSKIEVLDKRKTGSAEIKLLNTMKTEKPDIPLLDRDNKKKQPTNPTKKIHIFTQR